VSSSCVCIYVVCREIKLQNYCIASQINSISVITHMMMAIWGILLYVLFPVPLFVLIMLSIPLPEFCKDAVRGAMLYVTEIIFMHILPGGFSIFSFAMLLSTCLLVFSTSDVLSHNNRPVNPLNPMEQKCGRWRSERNFWISVLAFVVWLVLNRFRSALYEAQKYRKALKDAERKQD
jgi:hypothetical protein